MARVLVTGATGFIGRQLVEALQSRGDDVTCLVRTKSPADSLSNQDIRPIIGDVTDPDSLPAAVADANTVYHVAGLTKANSLAAFCRVNESGVRNVVEACTQRTTPPTVLVVSSLAAAGPMTEPRPRTELDPIRPVSKYGRSKRAGELAAETFAKDVPITVIRPPVVLGPGDVAGLTLFRGIRRFRSFTVLRKPRLVSVVHVADLVSAMICAAERGERLGGASRSTILDDSPVANRRNAAPGYYFIAADEQQTFVELGRMVARAVGRPHAWTLRVPNVALWLAGATGELIGQVSRRPRYMNLDRARDVAAGHWACSAEKAHRELGFAVGAPLEERIRQTAQWYVDHGWLRSIENRWAERK
jgi:dihydroflavonol-4-reductase